MSHSMTEAVSECRRRRAVTSLLSTVLWIVLSGIASAAAQALKLNGSMLRPFRGEVDHVQLSPDGVWTIYEAPRDTGELGYFSVRTKGGHPNELAVSLRLPRQTAITPDSRSFLYTDQASPGLFRVPIDGSRGPTQLAPHASAFDFTPGGERVVYNVGDALFSLVLEGSASPVRLTPPLVAGGSIWPFRAGRGGRLAPDRVVYLADAETDGLTEVFSVPADGSAAPVKLNAPSSSMEPWFIAVAPGGERVVYLTEFLMSAPIAGGSAPVVLSNAPIRDPSYTLDISPDGRTVVFLAEPRSTGVFELMSVPIDGSRPAVRLNTDLPAGGDVGSFRIAPDGRRVVYSADQEANDAIRLYSVAIEGGSAPVGLSHQLQPNEDVFGFALGRDHLVYDSRERVDDRYVNPELYSVPIVGGADPILLAVDAVEVRVSPDGTRVVFIERESVGKSGGLYSVPIGGGADPVLLDGAGFDTTGITPKGDTVLYRANRDLESVFELFSVPVTGGPSVQLNVPMAALAVADVVTVEVGPDGERAAFIVLAETCNCDSSGAFELHVAGISPSSPAVRIADDIGTVRFSPDGAWMVFAERVPDGEDFGRLFSAPADGSLAPIELASDVSRFNGFVVTLDGGHVVYARADPLAGVYRRAIDGSSPASLLALGNVEGLALAPDGTRVVYAQKSAGAFELFSVAVDGGSAPVQLNDLAFPRGNARYPFAITPGGERVFFWTDQNVDEVVELFSVPIGGGAPPTKLSGTLVAGGDVVRYPGVATQDEHIVAVSPDGARLVYLADALVDNVVELFSVPVDGSAAPVRLNATLPTRRAVIEYALAGSSRVVYRADQAADDLYELFSAPIDGSAPPLRLSAPLVAGGDVAAPDNVHRPAFAVSPDGERVAYLADQGTDEAYELFGVLTDGSNPPRRLGGPFVSGADVRDPIQLTPDGKNVVYLADQDVDEVVELFAASLDGGKGRRLSAPLVVGGDVGGIWSRPPAITPDGRWVLYIADQDTDTVQELYRVRLTAPPPGPAARPR